ncbi:MAG: hypothetical protein WBC55_01285 [Dehalococcoidia bacterium]
MSKRGQAHSPGKRVPTTPVPSCHSERSEESRDGQKVSSFFTDDCVFEDMAVGVVNRGKEEVKDFAAAGL